MDKEKSKLKKFCMDQGASLFGVADISKVKKDFNLQPEEIQGLDRAICIGYALSKKVLDGAKDHPTKLYYHHYKQVNSLLDQIALQVVSLLQKNGFNGLAIPASQVLNWEKQEVHLSHRKIARMAGLGWIGRSNLLINEKIGSNFRLVTVLTDALLVPDKEINFGCSKCRACVIVCPAKAIKDEPLDFDHVSCYEKLREFRKLGYGDQYICGVCVRVCRGNK